MTSDVSVCDIQTSTKSESDSALPQKLSWVKRQFLKCLGYCCVSRYGVPFYFYLFYFDEAKTFLQKSVDTSDTLRHMSFTRSIQRLINRLCPRCVQDIRCSNSFVSKTSRKLSLSINFYRKQFYLFGKKIYL